MAVPSWRPSTRDVTHLIQVAFYWDHFDSHNAASGNLSGVVHFTIRSEDTSSRSRSGASNNNNNRTNACMRCEGGCELGPLWRA